VPELAGSVFAEVSLRQVLNMTTALDYTEEYEQMTPGSVHFEYFRRLGFVADFELIAQNPFKDDMPRGVRALLPRLQMRTDSEAGDVYEYQSPNVDVIGWLIERISGQPLQDFIQEHIWSKLGAEHDAFFNTDLEYAPIATGGYNTTLRDAARFGLAALHEGELGGQQILPAGWMRDSYDLSEADKAAGRSSVFADPDGPRYLDGFQGYRSFWWVWDPAAGERQAMGVHGQVIYVNKARNLVIATLASPEQTANVLRPSFKRLMTGTRALARAL
jgi:CubicO group peptidase (beta-lactamase class C family)